MNGLSMQMLLLDAATTLVGFATNWLIQSTLLIAAGLAIGWMLRRRGSAVQSVVYRTTLLAAIVCPLATSLLAFAGISGWSLEMPTPWTLQPLSDAPMEIAEKESASAEITSARPVARAIPADDPPPVETSPFSTGTAGALAPFPDEPWQETFSALPPDDNPALDDQPAFSSVYAEEASARESAETSLFQIRTFGLLAIGISLFYWAVSAVLLFRLAMGWRRMHRLRSAAVPAEAATQRACQELASLLSVDTPEVLRSPYFSSPCLVGLTRPAVLLPGADPSLPLRDVLIHELAHLRRRDCHWNLLRHLAGALLFYQPLLWMLSRRLDETAEEVCDDFVVQFGGDREEYAHRLVDIAEFSSTPASVAGVGIVTLRSFLAKRVSRIMDTSRSLSTRASNLLLAVVIAGGLTGTLVVGLVGLGPQSSLVEAAADEPVAAETNVEGQVEKNAAAATEIDTVDKDTIDYAAVENADDVNLPPPASSLPPENSSDDATLTYAGKVVDPKGTPVSGADIYLVYHVPEPTAPLIPRWNPLAVTDAEGNFRFTMSEGDFGDGASAREWKNGAICAVAPGYGFACSSAMFFETGRDALQEMRERLKEIPAPYRENVEKMLAQAGQPLRLVADDQPIRGQVVDINGQPVVGAKLTLLRTYLSYDESLDTWLEVAQSERSDFYSARETTPLILNGPQVRSLVTPPVTGPDGRFTLHGVGRERIVQLLVEGTGIQSDTIYARTRVGDRIELLQEHRSPDIGNFIYHPAELTHVAGPSKPIVGLVRDKATGDPLVGITIKSQQRHGNRISGWGQDFVRTLTDDQGRYQLEGMPIGSDNRIAAIAPEDRAYLSTSQRAATDIDAEQLEIDFALQAAVWIEGRVTDASTGKGVSGRVSYLVDENNPDRAAATGLGSVDERDRHRADDDGRFRIPGMPGPGYVTFQADDHEKYARATGITNADGQSISAAGGTLRASQMLVPTRNYHVIAEVNPQRDSGRHELNLRLASGGNLVGRFVDPDGQPLGDTDGIYYSGQLAAFSMSWDLARGDSFEVVGYEAARPRQLVFYHSQRNLAGSLLLKGQPPAPLVAQLLPAGKVRGRLVDHDGHPLTDLQLMPWTPVQSSPADVPSLDGVEPIGIPLPPNRGRQSEYEIGDDGHFEIDGLAPGVKYRLRVMDRQSSPLVPPQVFQPLDAVIQVQAGETLDLGDVRLADEAEFTAQARASQAAAGGDVDDQSDEKDQKPTTDLHGRVIDADGKPVVGAKLHWIRSRVHDLHPLPARLVATTDDAGRFRFTPPSLGGPEDEPASWSYSNRIVVTAAGHGFVITSAEAIRGGTNQSRNLLSALAGLVTGAREIALPATGLPIHGRLVDINGQGVAGASVCIRWFNDEKDGGRGIEEAEARGAENAAWSARVDELLAVIEPVQLREVLPRATTDAEGRFELRDLGPKRLVQLLVEGEGIESVDVVARNEPGETIVVASNRYEPGSSQTVYPSEFLHAIGPSKPVEGQVLDRDTNQPIAGAVVRAYRVHGSQLSSSRERQQFATTTDAGGRYRITGLPIGDGNRLVALTTGDLAYVPIGQLADTSAAGVAIQRDFHLPRGIWADGRVFDTETDQPLVGEISYYFFRDRELEAAIPGLRAAYVDGRYWTNANGEFRVPVLASRGILAFRDSGSVPNGGNVDRFARGFGADAIEGAEEFGGSKMFPTAPSYLIPANYTRVAEVHPTESQETIRVDLPLFASQPVTVRAVDEEGKPVTRFQVYGASVRSGWRQMSEGPQFEILDLLPGEQRKVFVFHRDRNLVGGGFVNHGTEETVQIKLTSAGSVEGRLVDADGAPITDASLFVNYEKLRSGDDSAMWAPHPQLTANPTTIPVDEQGRFRLEGLIPGWSYHAHASALRKLGSDVTSMVIGSPLEDLQVEPGEHKDLGDLVIGDQKSGAAEDVKNADIKNEEVKNDAPAHPPRGKVVTGRITSGGQPAAGAHVAIMGTRIQASRGGDLSRGGEVIAVGIADEDGHYQLHFAGVSSKTHRYAGLVARLEGTAIAWRMLNLDATTTELALELPPEEPIRGKLIDIEGQPASGVLLTIQAVAVRDESGGFGQEGMGYPGGDRPPAAWLPPVTSDEQGLFAIRGVPAGHGVFMSVEGTDRFAPQDISLNTGMPEQRGERDGTYRSLVKNVKPGEEGVLTLPPAQWFEGVVRYEDSGEPAAHARINIWASQEEYGSMVSVAGQADDQGRYRVNPKPGIRFGLTAYPPDGAPYLARQTPLSNAIRWEAGDRVKQVDITLPRGVLVRGKIVEAGTGDPVPGASVQYLPQSANNPNVSNDILTGWQDIQLTTEEGWFSITVLPGPGQLLVHGQAKHVLREIGGRQLGQGQPGGVRNYAHAIEPLDPDVGAEPLEVNIELLPGGTVAGRIVDPRGELVEEALVISRLKIAPTSLRWRGHVTPTLGGRFELSGLADNVEYPVHFLDVRHQLGATATLKTGGPEEVDVVLQPCGKARLRAVDSEGEPVAGYEALVEMVVTPGAHQFDSAGMQKGELAADADSLVNIDRINQPWPPTKSDQQGYITVPALIPGANYRIVSHRDGQFHVAKDFQARASQTLDLGDVIVERPQ